MRDINTSENFMKTITLDTSLYDSNWENFKGYSCPVLTVPMYFASAVKREKTISGKLIITRAKVNGLWFHVHCENSPKLKVGEYRVPSYRSTGSTKVEKVMTSKEMSDYIASITDAELKNMANYAEKLNSWLMEKPDRHSEHLIHVINGACWQRDEPKAHYTIPNWEVVLRMCKNVISFDITDGEFKKRYITVR